MSELVDRLEDMARLHRSRGARRDCQVHGRFEPDCWFCQLTTLEDAIIAIANSRKEAKPEPDSAEWWRQVAQGLAAEIAKMKPGR